ncbi:MAG: M4 family metallopeptidase, partial [Bacteroidales bacterium]|nr:M4 family metallopeptidase [Bacteroidales bacterium]
DSYSGIYRLRETGRGNGIETYDMNEGTNYGNAVDFEDTDNYWDNVNPQQDEVATDAHWGAESTYDYYWLEHGRNSIDGNGFALRSYIHYDVAYANAFWDGQRMTYGDGDGVVWSPLTALDICAHEITHGLTSFTANLIYSYESGALNEAYSDIFGCSVEWYAKPTMANWLMGEDIGSPLRSMQDPNAFNDPDTYLGNYWATGPGDYGGVHTNCGVLSYWYYLLSDGGSGVNDNGDAYNVSGLGLDTAGAIAFRTLTVYLIPSTQYIDARFYSILAANDLYGACSQAVQSTTNAFHAVGVGNAYIPGVQADFSADLTAFCDVPATVNFINQSNNATTFSWDFGDGSTSTAVNPSHTYTSFGTFDVKLIADGGSCGIDSITKVAYIDIDPGNPCIIIIPQNGTASSNSCFGKLFDSGGTGNYQDNTNSTFTINPVGASNVTLSFLSFGFEVGYDYLYIYDGPNTSSLLIGQYDGNTLPNGGTIISTSDAITVQQITDGGVTDIGFELDWSCNYPTSPPVCNFLLSDTISCSGEIKFTDISTNGPSSWLWDFGDGYNSTQKNPFHIYTVPGTYTVKLVASNVFGSDSLTMTNVLLINIPQAPVTTSGSHCGPGSVALFATGSDSLYWYDDAVTGNLVNTGSGFNTPVLSQTTNYYVENVIGDPPAFGAKPDNSGGGSYYSSPTSHYLVFDCFETVKLVSVKVYANGGDYRNIELRTSTGVVIQDTNIFIPDGESRITLNFDLPIASNLRLAGPDVPNLYRNNNGLSYPYFVSNFIEIKYSSANSNPTGFYYFFYDWEVEGEQCFSTRTMVTATINNFPAAGFTLLNNDPIVDFTDASSDAGSYYWDFGDNSYSNLASPSHTYTSNGVYAVKQIVANSCGSDTAENSVNISSILSGYSVIGNITYNNTPPSTIMNNVKTYLFDDFGNLKDSTITDVNGDYIFTGVIPGNYTTEPNCTKTWGGSNSSDALAVMKHFVNIQALTGLPLLAADVDVSSYINTADALMIAQRFVLMINSFPSGDWVFENNPLVITHNNIINDFKGLCYGDVDKSYVPPSVKISPSLSLENSGIIEINSINEFDIPLKAGTDMKVGAVSLVLEYPNDLIDIIGIKINSDEGTLVYNTINDQLRISWYSLSPKKLTTGETLLYITARCKSNVDEGEIFFTLNHQSVLSDNNAETINNSTLLIPKIIFSSQKKYFLGDNYPNPCTGMTDIEYTLAENAKVSLIVYNFIGEKIAIIVDEQQDEGNYKITYDGSGNTAGIYFYKLEAVGLGQTYFATKTMIISN